MLWDLYGNHRTTRVDIAPFSPLVKNDQSLKLKLIEGKNDHFKGCGNVFKSQDYLSNNGKIVKNW